MVLSVAFFSRSEVVRDSVLRSDIIREETLKRCYNISGYQKLSIAEKNKIYDKIKAIVESTI